ncbi:MAG: hypothetical protein WCP69_12385 [Bacteroidota bacterium]|jgi:hypothetical protein
MEDNTNQIESLFKKTTDYGKTSYELIKLKALEKTSDVVSTIISHTFIVVIITSFMLFINLGIAFWLGEIFGKIYYGFFAIAAFYFLTVIILDVFMHNWLKHIVQNYLIKQVLK